ncbi:hypothetical protein FRB95_000201 [Tulasnella sp. JGI-2019a]|nr:hypothetical protein FRB95_000201 [Tulasnella sp. JGI-2019a]
MATQSLTCTRKGCGKQYDPSTAVGNSCAYHPGNVVFHEGLKSYSCCSDLPGHRPVLDFDEFMKIPGCTTGKHATEQTPVKAPAPAQPSTSSVPSVTVSKDADGKEIYTTTGSSKPPATASHRPLTPPPAPKKLDEDEDDLEKPVEGGATCQRQGCNATFINDAESRTGNGEAATCQYHPMPPLFREGSKGYLCCKPKVLEFEEFLKIPGCKTGRHVFVKKIKPTDPTDELVQPRIDHYQTPSTVHVTVYAKKVDQDRSSVVIKDEHVHLDLYLPESKRCLQTLTLYGTVQPDQSTFKIFGTKVEITLVKKQARAWSLLEKTDAELPPAFGYTFGTSGRTGTIGAKDAILDANNINK